MTLARSLGTLDGQTSDRSVRRTEGVACKKRDKMNKLPFIQENLCVPKQRYCAK